MTTCPAKVYWNKALRSYNNMFSIFEQDKVIEKFLVGSLGDQLTMPHAAFNFQMKQ